MPEGDLAGEGSALGLCFAAGAFFASILCCSFASSAGGFCSGFSTASACADTTGGSFLLSTGGIIGTVGAGSSLGGETAAIFFSAGTACGVGSGWRGKACGTSRTGILGSEASAAAGAGGGGCSLIGIFSSCFFSGL